MFKVYVEVLNENDEFVTVARNLLVKAVYKSEAIKQAIREKYSELYESKLKGKSWRVQIIDWQ